MFASEGLRVAGWGCFVNLPTRGEPGTTNEKHVWLSTVKLSQTLYPAVHYKSGAISTLGPHRVFHFHPAASDQQTIFQHPQAASFRYKILRIKKRY